MLTALFTYNDGKQRQIKCAGMSHLDAPVPGWQLTVSTTETYFVAAANVKELCVRSAESSGDGTAKE
jgi:hypothetical protein